jgi:hypothetical protein
MELSALRLLGVIVGVLLLLALAWRRRAGALLGRTEFLLWPGAVVLVTVALRPGVADGLVAFTGLTGDLSRIVSVLAVAVLGLGVLVVRLAGEGAETRHRLLALLREVPARAVPTGEQAEILCIMPALNEAENLPVVLAQMPRELEGHRVRCLVVDDGSTDGTPEVAEANGALVARSLMNVGGGHALQIGFAAAVRLGARWVVTLDADGQHQPAELALLMAPLLHDQADVVVGSRHLGQSVGHERTRALGLRLFNALLSFLLGRRITDCSSGYRAFDLARLRTLRLVQDRHHTAELLIEAARKGLRIQEVGIVISPRLSGESKKGTNWRYGVRFARTVAQAWWG